MTPSPGLVILGNGGAAIHAVTAARNAGHTGPIHLVSDTPGPAFNPMLSPYFLAGKIPFEDCFPFGDALYETHRVTRHFGSPVTALDTMNKEIFLESGERLDYDRCLVATGAGPTLPDIPGLKDSPCVFTLRTPEDALRLWEAFSSAKHALVLGASMIGVKLAEILMGHGITVTLVDVAGQVMPHAAHPDCASRLAQKIREKGVALHLDRSLEGVENRGKNSIFYFNDGQPLESDLCLVSTGVQPNLDFVDPHQVELDRGILVDERMRASAEGIYAAGDISQGLNPVTGKKEMIGLWGNACMQGRTAGQNMAGSEAVYPGTIPQHINSFFGLDFVHLGDINQSGEDVKVLANSHFSGGAFYLLVFEKDRLVGANTINTMRHAGGLKSSILRKVPWSDDLDSLMGNPTDEQIDRVLASFRMRN